MISPSSNLLPGCYPQAIEATTQDIRVRGARFSEFQIEQAQRIEKAIEHLLNQAEVQRLLGSKNRPESAELHTLISRALQTYSRDQGVLKLVDLIREAIRDPKQSRFLLDGVPLSKVQCRVHGALEHNGFSSEVSGTSEIGSHELGRVILARSASALRDSMGRKTHLLRVQCELAPNLYESPLSAIMLGVAQDVFLYPKVLNMFNQHMSGCRDERFMVEAVSCLGVPAVEDPLAQILHQTEMQVFEQMLNACFRYCLEQETAVSCLSKPVSDMMNYKIRRMAHDAPLGKALQDYLNHQAGNYAKQYDLEELIDVFQAQIRDCRLASAPLAAIGRAYFNSQFRNALCAVNGITSPRDIAAFELKVRAYRELRTSGLPDAPINTALVSKLWAAAPEAARIEAHHILSQSASSESMMFEFHEPLHD